MQKAIAALLLVCSPQSLAAESADWQFQLPVFLTAGTHVQQSGDARARFDTISLFVEFRLRPGCRPWSTALFVNYEEASNTHSADTLKAGLLFRHETGEWDSLAAVFRSYPQGRPHASGYLGRIRYRFSDRRKIGVESFGSAGQLDSSYLMLGYYDELSSRLSLRVVAGSSLGSKRTRAGRLEFAWQIN